MRVANTKFTMKTSNHLILSTSPQSQLAKKPRITASLTHRHRFLYRGKCRYNTGKERDSETGLYYYGARYLDSKTGRWLSGDPAMADYVPSAPVNDEARKRNGSLPGQGGVFNYVNLHVYHYAGNNPVKLVDPNGRESGYVTDENAVANFGHSGMFVQNENGKFTYFEVTGFVDGQEIGTQYINNKSGKKEENTEVLSTSPLEFPTPASGVSAFSTPNSGVAKKGEFDSFEDMYKFLSEQGYTNMVIFPTTPEQDAVIYDAASRSGADFNGYNVFTNNCGQWANTVLSTAGSGVNPSNTSFPGPNVIGRKLLKNNNGFAYSLRIHR